MHARDTQLQAAAKTAQEMKEEADSATLALNKAVSKLTASEEERARLTTRAEEAEAVSKNLTELHQQAQKYQSQLQDYNAKLQGDVAALNDTINGLRVRTSGPFCVSNLCTAFALPIMHMCVSRPHHDDTPPLACCVTPPSPLPGILTTTTTCAV